MIKPNTIFPVYHVLIGLDSFCVKRQKKSGINNLNNKMIRHAIEGFVSKQTNYLRVSLKHVF